MTDDRTRETITLAECPIGLFESDAGELCLKTEYGNNEGRIDAYIVSSGEFFWGTAPQTIANQRIQLVRPFDIAAALLAAERRAFTAGQKIMREAASAYCAANGKEGADDNIRALPILPSEETKP